MARALLLLAALCGSAAFSVREILGPPRTRASALAWAKDKILRLSENTANESALVPPKASSLPQKASTAARNGQASMVLSLEYSSGSVDAPSWLLPAAAMACYILPITLLYISGDMSRDAYQRLLSDVSLKERAAEDFVNGLGRIGALTKKPQRVELGTRSNLPTVAMFAGDEDDQSA